MDEGFDMALLVGALTPASVCVWAGAQHAVKPGALASALRQPHQLHRVLGPLAARQVARGWGAVEAGTGVAVCLVLFVPPATGAQLPVLLWLTIVHAGFAAWLATLWRRMPDATCGCDARSEPADQFALLRAGVLGAGAAGPTLALLAGQQLAVPRHGWLALPVAATLGLLVWILPGTIRPVEVAR